MVDSIPKIQTTAAGRRSKREAPGPITHSSQDGGAAVSVSRRRTKPNKQAKTGEKGMDSELPEIRVDMDGKQELIDPDEERFCLCGDISYGEMICCELEERVSRTSFRYDSSGLIIFLISANLGSGFTWTVLSSEDCRLEP
jgi:hypothetical protein